MAENDVFERSLAGAFLRLADDVPGAVDAAAVAHRVALEHPRSRARGLPWRVAVPRRAWALLLLTGLLATLLAGALLVGSQMQRKLPAVVPPVAPSAAPSAGPATPSPTPAITGPAGAWDPILATTRAKPAPTAATCPIDTDPDTPGPADQERPRARWMGNLAAAFDRHSGRIVYVDLFRATWTFDVCTNTWHRMDSTGAMIGGPGGLVYDVDSDRTVALGFEHISVYDANTNTWTQPGNSAVGMSPVYDPVSGLVLTMGDEQKLWAYDVDTNHWTLVGRVTPGVELLGYSQMIDRLIFGSGTDGSVTHTTTLVDPRTGQATRISTDTPYVDLGWPKGVYGPAADTVYVLAGDDVCGFDSDSLTWNACFDTPVAVQEAAVYAMVGDPINQRLILINGIGGAAWPADVWAIDLDNGEWTRLLEPSDQ